MQERKRESKLGKQASASMLSRSSKVKEEVVRHLKFDEEFFIPPKQKVQYLKRLTESTGSNPFSSYMTAKRTELPVGQFRQTETRTVNDQEGYLSNANPYARPSTPKSIAAIGNNSMLAATKRQRKITIVNRGEQKTGERVKKTYLLNGVKGQLKLPTNIEYEAAVTESPSKSPVNL